MYSGLKLLLCFRIPMNSDFVTCLRKGLFNSQNDRLNNVYPTCCIVSKQLLDFLRNRTIFSPPCM